MKKSFVSGSLSLVMLAICLAPCAQADPTTSFAQPVANQIDADIAALSANPSPSPAEKQQLSRLNQASRSYRRNSRSLATDISILQSIDSLLSAMAAYPPLIESAANSYRENFQQRRDELVAQVIRSPRGEARTAANTIVTNLSAALIRAANTTANRDKLRHLRNAATAVGNGASAVRNATNAPVSVSSMGGRIGDRGDLQFESTPGKVIGTFTTNVLDLAAIDLTSIVRGIHLRVEGSDLSQPNTYSLVGDKNTALYVATDRNRKVEYRFEAIPGLTFTNATGTNVIVSMLTIDAVTTNYVLGRFAFAGEDFTPNEQKTNAVVTLGEFQLNR